MNEQEPNVTSQVYGGLSSIMRVLIFGTVAVGILLLVRIIFLFFGSLKTVPGYEQVISYTDLMLAPFQVVDPIKTPYDGIFDLAATGGLLFMLFIEFVLASVQHSLDRKSIQAARQARTAAAQGQTADVEKEPVRPL